MVPYVDDTSGWREWQRAYRLGLILILPPPEVSVRIDPLRAAHDPASAAYCPTHISVSDPLRREMTPDVEADIRARLHTVRPFTLHFDRPRASTEHAGVAYPIRPREPIDDLKRVLHGSPAFAPDAHRRRDIPPHMTIAEFLSIEESLALCARLQDSAPSGSFLCDRLAFVVPDENFRFRRAGEFPLAGARTHSRRDP